MSKKALVTGITGQDGSFLAELLLEKNYEVHGIIRRSSTFNTGRIEHLMDNKNLYLHHGDLLDTSTISHLVSTLKPDELYNLGAQSHVKVSFELPIYTSQIDALGTLHILEAIRMHSPKTKFYQASTSELYGLIQEPIQNETTPFYPRSPYGVAKLYGYWIVKNYREAYGLYACNGILFNHESERRGETFITRKITRGLTRIKNGKQNTLVVGNIDTKRDWGYAKDYVEGMWRMLQQNSADDYVLATGKCYSVRQFIEITAKKLGWEIRWEGVGDNEKGYDKDTNKLLVEIDPKYYRPTEVNVLIGDYSKAKKVLGWEPKVDLDKMIDIMIDHDTGNA